jgi:predicted acylesterase/phospholipase RssA
MNYDTLCLSGGGIMGLVHIGCLEYLEKNKKIKINNIKKYIGTSIGALICFLLSLKYSIYDIKIFLINFNFKFLEPDIDIDELLLNYGIDNGDKILYIISMFLNNKYNLNNLTFIEHYNLLNVKLSIVGSNYTLQREENFNYIETPNMSILTALRISISVPILFTPVLYNNMYYIDGGIYNNCPIKYCNLDTTLAINLLALNNSNTNNIDNIVTYFITCINLVLNNFYTLNKDHINIIKINCNSLTNLTDFDLLEKEKNNFIKLGYEAGEKYINEISINKLDKKYKLKQD